MLREPYMICGLPDVGFVAKQAADYLVEKLKAKLFEEIYSPHFPPYVLIKRDGTVELMKNEFYFWENTEMKNDIVILTGNTQALTPEGQYELVDKTLTRAKMLGVKKIFTLTSYLVNNRPQNEKPKIYGVVTNPELKEELATYEVQILEKGSIKGFNGLLLGMASLKKIEGVCLLSETIDYAGASGRMLIDVKSAQTILEVLMKILGFQIDLSDMGKQAKITEEFIQKLEESERQVLEQLSKTYPPRKQVYYI